MELILEEAGKMKTGKPELEVVLPEPVEGAKPELLAEEVVPVVDASDDAGTEGVGPEVGAVVLVPDEEPPDL